MLQSSDLGQEKHMQGDRHGNEILETGLLEMVDSHLGMALPREELAQPAHRAVAAKHPLVPCSFSFSALAVFLV